MHAALDPRRPGPLHLVLVGAAVLLLLGSVPPFDQDEAAYAGFAHKMLATGDLRLPGFPLSEIHRKPPLSFWLIAGSFRLLGESWWSLRLPVALSFLATLGLLATWGGAVFGKQRARTAAVLLGTSTAVLFGRLALTDGVLLLWESVAVLGLLRWLAGHGRRWLLGVGLGVGLALLTKGPAVVVLLVGLLPVLLLHPQRERLPAVLPVLLLAMLPLVAWGAWAWGADGGQTIRWMVDWYLLRRAGGTTLGQTGPPGTYALLLLVLFLPWAGLVPAGLRLLWAGLHRREPAAVGLAGWLLGGWLLWELLPSKLPAYALGAWPALALVAAEALHRVEQAPRWVGAGLLVQALVLLALLGGVAWAGAWPLAAFLLLLLALALWQRSPGLLALVAPVLVVGAWALVLPRLQARLHPTWTVAQRAAELAPAGVPAVIQPAWHLPSLPYHLAAAGHPVRIAGEGEVPQPGELWITAEALPGASCEERVEGWIPDKGQQTAWVLSWWPERGEGCG